MGHDGDPAGNTNLADEPGHLDILRELERALVDICDPAVVDARAFLDQDAMIARYGGRDAGAGPNI